MLRIPVKLLSSVKAVCVSCMLCDGLCVLRFFLAIHCPTIPQFIPIEKCVQYRMMHDACTPLVRGTVSHGHAIDLRMHESFMHVAVRTKNKYMHPS